MLDNNFINTVNDAHTLQQKTQIGCSLETGLQLLHDLRLKQKSSGWLS